MYRINVMHCDHETLDTLLGSHPRQGREINQCIHSTQLCKIILN